jgi:hypothetical protein
VAPRLLLAVTADGEVGFPRQRGEKREEPARRRALHLGTVSPDEALPRFGVSGLKRDPDEIVAGSQVGQPDVVEVAGGERVLGNAARRAAHRADAETLATHPRAPEPDDADRHAYGPFRVGPGGLSATGFALYAAVPPGGTLR